MAGLVTNASLGRRMVRAAKTSRRVRLVDRADGRRAKIGQEFRLKPNWGAFRGVGHAKALHISAYARLQLTGVDYNAISGYEMRSLFGSIRLQLANGQILCENIDGRQVLDDQWARSGGLTNVVHRPHFGIEGASFPDITDDRGLSEYDEGDFDEAPSPEAPAVVFVPISLTLQLADPMATGRDVLRDLVPVALFDGDGDTGLTIQIRDTLPGGNQDEVQLTGIYSDPMGQRDGVDVWAEVVDLPAAVSKGWSRIVQWTDTQQNGTLEGIPEGARVVYAMINYLPGDVDDIPSAVRAHSSITVETGGELYMRALSPDDAAMQTRIEAWQRPFSAERLNIASLAAPLEDETGLRKLFLIPPRDRAAAPCGPVSFSFERTAEINKTRYLARIVEPMTVERAQRTAAALEECGCPCSAPLKAPTGASVADPYEPALTSKATHLR